MMNETTTVTTFSAPRYYCGKCGSPSLYSDNDPFTGSKSIACQTCGNRYPGGPSPTKLQTLPKLSIVDTVPAKPLIHKEPPSAPSPHIGTITGTCPNCNRPNLKLDPTICHQCAHYVRNGNGNGDREKRLAEAAELYGKLKPGERAPYGQATKYPARKKKKKEKYQVEKVEKVKQVKPSVIETRQDKCTDEQLRLEKNKAHVQNHIQRVAISFYVEDMEIFNHIYEQAKKGRRTLAQQILLTLEGSMNNEIGSKGR
jgi:hypothetical protein